MGARSFVLYDTIILIFALSLSATLFEQSVLLDERIAYHREVQWILVVEGVASTPI